MALKVRRILAQNLSLIVWYIKIENYKTLKCEILHLLMNSMF